MAAQRARRWAILALPAAIIALVFALVAFVLIILVPAASGPGAGNHPSVAGTSCVPTPGGGGGLRPGSVPNGWEPNVIAAGQAAGIDPAVLAAQLETESSWNPNAVGPMTKYGTAKGMGQFIDDTWAAYGSGSPFDPLNAIAAQGKYMGVLLQSVTPLAQSSGQQPIALALAAYNAGPGAVEAAGSIPPFAETQKYVPKILALAQEKYSGSCQPPAGAGPGIVPGPGGWTTPLPGAVLTSGYGPRWGTWHAGIDLATPGDGGTVVAATSMVIETAGCTGDGYGCSVTGRDSATGYMMRYGHMAKGTIVVSVGQSVAAGAPLGTEGATGQVTGVHLHFEIYSPGSPLNAYHSSGMDIDPMPVLVAKGVQI